MSNKPITVYSASAGSGKTYTLSQKYLELILGAVENDKAVFTGYRNILAVTFTKKAAGEMKKRILEDLAKCAAPQPFDKKTTCAQVLGVDEKVIELRAAKVLRNLLFDYSRFDLLTIDSFVDRVVRNFAREQKLSANYDLEIKTRNIHKYLIAETLDLVDDGAHSDLKKWLIELQNSTLENDKKVNIAQSLGKSAGLLLNDEFQTLTENGSRLKDLDGQLVLWKRSAQEKLNSIYQALVKYRQEVQAVLDKYGVAAEDFKGASKSSIPLGILKTFDNALSFDLNGNKSILNWNPDLNKFATFYQRVGEEEKWITKNSSASVREATNELIPFLLERIEAIRVLAVEFNTISIIHKNYFQLGILGYMFPLLQKYRDENNLILLKDELDIAIKIGEDFSPEILFEKLGRRYNHLFIDEFQDTGRKQWKFFKPIIENTAGENHFNLIVGDVKQSIYEWRGGDLKLLHEGIYKDLPGLIGSKQLSTNWRSSARVIEFNNQLFEALPKTISNEFKSKIDFENLSENQKGKVESGMKLLQEAFSSVRQEIPQHIAKTNKGYVEWTIYDKPSKLSTDEEEAENARDIAFKLLVNKIKDVQDRGFKAGEIAILVRKGAEAEAIAGYLSKSPDNKNRGGNYNLELVSADSIKIAYSDSVRVILAACKFLLKISSAGKIRPDFQKNDSFRFILAELLTELKRIKGMAFPEWEDITGLNSAYTPLFIESILPAPFLETPSKIIRMGLPELMEEIIRLFGLDKLENQEPYLNTFMAFVLDYAQTKGATLKGLIKEFSENEDDLKIAIPESSDAIKLLTIHTSKGLEYPVVILPFGNLDIVKATDSQTTYIIDTEGTEVKEFSFYPVVATKESFNSHFGERVTEKITRLTLANLNLVYVACTRAKEELHFIGAKPAVTTKGETAAKDSGSLIHLFLNNEGLKASAKHSIKDGVEVFSFGEPTGKNQAEDKPMAEGEIAIAYPSTSWRPKLTIRPISKPKADDSDTLDDKLSLGNFIHELMASVETAADLKPQALTLLQNGNYNPILLDKTLEGIEDLMQMEPVKQWYDKPLKVFKELEIWLAKEGQNPEVKRPDRVVVLPDKTVVIDFKTGKESPAHHSQVKDYCSILEEMRYSNLEGWLVYIFGAGPVPVKLN